MPQALARVDENADLSFCLSPLPTGSNRKAYRALDMVVDESKNPKFRRIQPTKVKVADLVIHTGLIPIPEWPISASTEKI